MSKCFGIFVACFLVPIFHHFWSQDFISCTRDFKYMHFYNAVAPRRIQVSRGQVQLQSIASTGNTACWEWGENFCETFWKDLYITSSRTTSVFLFSQDDRLREPLQKLKLAVSNVMPEQLCKYQEDCQARNQAKNAKWVFLESVHFHSRAYPEACLNVIHSLSSAKYSAPVYRCL